MQICLYPTYLGLEQHVLQNDMRRAMKTLVTDRLREEYPDRFGYFDFNDFQEMEWYSGEEDDPVCGDLQGVLPEAGNRQGMLNQNQDANEPMPCTCALYPGAVVFVTAGDEDVDMPNATIIEPQIASILESGLVLALQDIAATAANNNDGTGSKTTTPAYFELQAAAVSFDVAMREGSGNLVLSPEDEETLQPAPTSPPVTLILTQSPTNPSSGGDGNTISGIDAGNSLQASSENNMEKYGMYIIIAVAVLLVLTCLCLCCVRLNRFGGSCLCCGSSGKNDLVEEEHEDQDANRSPSPTVEKSGATDAPTVVGEEEEDEEHARDAATAVASEVTQYQRGELLDCVSVASEWTGDSASQDKSSAAGYSSRMLVAAELRAAKETFDRDRHITIQKDMLHSEWSATPAGAGMLDSTPDNSNIENALSFEQAYDASQGEEVYLMPPKSGRKLQR
ncbi:MAG: hypothetical protein SGILL_001772 [Bacillariaceae sp.]